jgi:hypothetical protein
MAFRITNLVEYRQLWWSEPRRILPLRPVILTDFGDCFLRGPNEIFRV